MPRLVRLVLLALCIAPAALAAQTSAQTSDSAPPSAPSPNLAGLAHVALRVHDLAASVAFYQKLGFVKAFELSREGKVYEAFIKINDRQFIELYPTDEKNPNPGFLHVCFEGADLHAAHDFYVAQGLTPKDVRTAGAGNLLFTMPGPLTPSGPQNLEYTQYMPGSLHSKDFGKNLGPDRLATTLAMVAFSVDDLAAARAFYKDKLAFIPHPPTAPVLAVKQSFSLPGTPGQSVYPLPASQLGPRCYLFLGTARLPTPRTLQARFTPTEINGDGFLIDPDNNWIFFKLDTASN
jgi:catechol 2,3-dioxygenase-like lactoylglutathione lyase family enzyme